MPAIWEKIQSNKRLFLILAGVVLVLVLITSILVIFKKDIPALFKKGIVSSLDYVIPGVPYFTMFNHKGAANTIKGPIDSSVASVLEYWNPGKTDLLALRNDLRVPANERLSPSQIQSVVEKQNNYSFSVEELSLGELKKYINSSVRTPLLCSLPLNTNEQSVATGYFPLSVLIGVSETEKKLTFHSFWLGNNYELTFDEFSKLQGMMRPNLRNKYLVIQPKDLRQKINEIKKRGEAAYPPRTRIMKKYENLFKDYAMLHHFFAWNMWTNVVDYASKIIASDNFDAGLPVYFQMQMLSELSEGYLNQGDLEKALDFANRAIALDHDLCQPSGDWAGFEIGINKPSDLCKRSDPYRVLGDIYKQKGDFAKAGENYQKALEILPGNVMAQQGLQSVQLELSKQK